MKSNCRAWDERWRLSPLFMIQAAMLTKLKVNSHRYTKNKRGEFLNLLILYETKKKQLLTDRVNGNEIEAFVS